MTQDSVRDDHAALDVGLVTRVGVVDLDLVLQIDRASLLGFAKQ